MLNDDEKIRYSKQLSLNEIGWKGQEKIKSSKILVIGAGGLGCPVIQYLTAAGVGIIGIVDGDTVEISNLQRQVLFSTEDIGKSKSKCVAIRMKLLNPYVKFNVIKIFLNSTNALEIFEPYDIIVDCSDNFQTRYLCNDASVLTGKPIVFGSISKFEGQICVFNYENGPSYRCLYPNPPKPYSIPSCSEEGVLGAMVGIIGSYQSNEVIKIICGIGDVLSGKLLLIHSLNHKNSVVSFEKNETVKITKLLDNYEAFCGIKYEENQIDFSSISEDYLLIDIRTPKERINSHIGGQHFPEMVIRNDPNLLNLPGKIVLYCESGYRCRKLIEDLKLDTEFKIQYLKGGIKSLKKNV